VLAQVIVAADPFSADENLRRGVDPMLPLEGIGLLAGLEVVILDRKPCRSRRSLDFRP